MLKCNHCEQEYETYVSLIRHATRTHKVNSVQFYVDFYLRGIWPLCKCGCNQKTKYSHQLKGFRDYCQGHQSRVKNNWGHNKSAITKSSDTRRKQFECGERTVWNIGLTKETDVIVKLYGEKRAAAFTDEIRDQYSDRMSKNRKNGIMPTLYGKDSSRWKGGVSEVNIIARSDKRLYDEWKYPILIRDGFKCIKCGGNDKLHIHHDKEQMCDIVKKHMPDLDPISDFELKKSIASKIVEYHIVNKVSGITLCYKCHNDLHPSLNFDV